MGQGCEVALCCLCGMSGMQRLYHDFCLFFKKRTRWGKQAAAEGEHCAEASSVTSGLHLAPDAWLLVQGWRCLCPLKPRGERGAGLLGNAGQGMPRRALEQSQVGMGEETSCLHSFIEPVRKLSCPSLS